MAEITYTAAELEALAKQLQPFLKSVSTPTDPGIHPPPPLDPPGPTPPAPPAALARFLAAPSDWARWTEDNWLGSAGGGYQVKEDAAIKAHLMAKYGWADGDADQRMRQQLNAYNATIKLAGVYSPATKTYKFVRYIVGFPILTADTGGAADAYIASRSPGVVPGPLV